MKTAIQGNFEFVKEIFPELYEPLHNAESLALLNHRGSGLLLRNVNELYCTLLLEEYGMSSGTEKEELYKKQYALRTAGKFPRFERYWYQTWNGTKKSDYWDGLWRKFGNSCHHAEHAEEEAAVTYENLITVFEIIFRVFRWEYERKKGRGAAGKLDDFSIDRMPIGEHYVSSAAVPVDEAVTHCIKEYETCSYDDSGRVEKYGIVRVFNKNDMDEKALALRDKEAFKEAANEAGIQFDGNVQVDVLSRMNSAESDYYIIIYKFSRKPARLNQECLSGMDLSGRIRLCRNIADILRKFHNLSTPIYHRNLSYDSIYVCPGRDGCPEPSIIKLDCAKIMSDEFGTVIETVQSREKLLCLKRMMKYVAPEVRRLFQGQRMEIDWSRADVYSLGILFGDILRGSLDADPASSAKLRREGADEKFLELMDRMRAPRPELRPSMNDVSAALEVFE